MTSALCPLLAQTSAGTYPPKPCVNKPIDSLYGASTSGFPSLEPHRPLNHLARFTPSRAVLGSLFCQVHFLEAFPPFSEDLKSFSRWFWALQNPEADFFIFLKDSLPFF